MRGNAFSARGAASLGERGLRRGAIPRGQGLVATKGVKRVTRTLSHYDRRGRVQMVDVSRKPPTLREAVASAYVKMSPLTLRKIKDNPKGDPFEVARIAGIAAAKRTADLIPLCHSLQLSHVDIQIAPRKDGVCLTSQVRSTGPTGVEMEALVAVAIAALTVYDMCKAVDKEMSIGEIRLITKTKEDLK